LFNPDWKLRLQTVADRLRGYFDHPEPKSNGRVGELKRKIIVSLDKHYIGKETSPLDDDNELLIDEPITTSSDLVLRGAEQNLQPLIDVGIEFADAVQDQRFRRGKRLTFAEMHKLKKDVVLHANGALSQRELTVEDYLAIDVPGWATRNKAWKNLRRLGEFPAVAELTGMPLEDIDHAARRGGESDFRCEEFDWDAILKATEDLMGTTARREAVKAARRKNVNWNMNRRGRAAASKLLDEIQDKKLVLFNTGIANGGEIDLGDDTLASDEIISPKFMPSEAEYWSQAARKDRAKAATAVRVAKHRKKTKP
jgi:hypothetical protein